MAAQVGGAAVAEAAREQEAVAARAADEAATEAALDEAEATSEEAAAACEREAAARTQEAAAHEQISLPPSLEPTVEMYDRRQVLQPSSPWPGVGPGVSSACCLITRPTRCAVRRASHGTSRCAVPILKFSSPAAGRIDIAVPMV